MLYFIYGIAGLTGGILIGMGGLTAAMVLTPILSGACGWGGYDAVTMSLIANVPSAIVTSWTYYKNGNVDLRQGRAVAVSAFAGAVVGSYLGYLFSQVSENGISYLVIVGNLFMAVKFFRPGKAARTASQDTEKPHRTLAAVILSFLIGAECGFMGSAGGVMMLMVLTLVLGMSTKAAVGTGSVVMTLVALTGAASHVMMGAEIQLLPCAVITAACTAGAVVSAKFANRTSDRVMNVCAGIMLVAVSAVSLLMNR